MEISVDDTLFIVHINPYFLRLNFSNKVLEDDSSSANYDPGSGYLTVTLTKEVRGQDFKDLDLLAKLLSPRPSENRNKPSIQVIAEGTSNDDIDTLVDRTDKLGFDRAEILEGMIQIFIGILVLNLLQLLKMTGSSHRKFQYFYPISALPPRAHTAFLTCIPAISAIYPTPRMK